MAWRMDYDNMRHPSVASAIAPPLLRSRRRRFSGRLRVAFAIPASLLRSRTGPATGGR